MAHALQSGRYQKSARPASAADAAQAGAGLRRWLPLLALFTAACAPVDAQQRSASVNPQPQPAAQASQPAIAVPPAVLAGLPPTNDTPALAAVQAAREAMNRKQWSVLGALVPQAKSDPLGMYPEYWLLRYQLWSPPAGGRLTPTCSASSAATPTPTWPTACAATGCWPPPAAAISTPCASWRR